MTDLWRAIQAVDLTGLGIAAGFLATLTIWEITWQHHHRQKRP